MKALRNYLVANVFALVPLLWIALGWMPDQVKIQWRGNERNPIAIVADGAVLQGEDYGKWAEGTVWRFYLREDMAWGNVSFRLPEGKGPSDVGRVDLQKWKLLKLGKAGAELELVEAAGNIWRFATPRFANAGFASRAVACGLAGVEAVLLGVSWLFTRRHREEKWKTLWPAVVLVTLSLTVLLQVALPVQSYWANQSAYPFSFRALAGTLAVRFPGAFVLSVVSIGLLSRCFGRWVLGVVLAFAVCMYLESGILSVGLPDLNGDWWFFQNKTRALWDAATWGGVFVLFALAHPVLKKHYGVVALCLLVMVVASLLDVRHEEKADTSKLIVHDFSPIETVVRSVTYSTNRNVLVFVIDSLEREQAQAVMQDAEAGAELREKFRGFTAYTNNVGTGEGSLPGVANLFTGLYPEGGAFLADYYASIYSGQSALKDFLDAGFAVFISPPALGYGYAYPSVHLAPTKVGPVLDARPGGGGQAWTLREINRFRSVPFAVKLPCARIMELSIPAGEDLLREKNAYPVLAAGGNSPQNRPVFAFIHTDGVHFPATYDRKGQLLAQKDNTSRGCVEMGVWVLGLLGKLFDVYRARGLYDNSLILVLADHGNWGGEEHDGFPDRAKPFLWIKAPESRHDYETSSIPTSHANVSKVLRESSHRILSEEEIGRMLQSDARLFRSVWGERVRDWIVDGEGKVQYSERRASMGDPSAMRPVPLGKFCSMALKNSTGNGELDLFFTNVNSVHLAAFGVPEESTTVSFRVPDANRQYALHLLLRLIDSGVPNIAPASIQFRQQNEGEKWKEFAADDWHLEIVLHNLVPDANGIITVEGRRGNGLNNYIYFSHLMLETE